MGSLKGLGHIFACSFLFNFSNCIVIPAITDVTVEALCPGEDHCSIAIYLSGITQSITGLGAFLVTPLVGNLSDTYGRKAMLTLPMTVGIFPLLIMAFGRTKPFFYAHYFIKMVAGMFCDGSMQSLTLAYVADRTSEKQRVSAFGVLSGVGIAGFVSATLTARLLPTSLTFQTSSALAITALLYMRLFLTETNCGSALVDESCAPLCPPSRSFDAESSPKLSSIGKAFSLLDMLDLFRSSLVLSRAAIVEFIGCFGTNGYQSAILYFLKAKFHFGKDQNADLLLINGIVAIISQLLLMPALASTFGEHILVSAGLLASFAHIFLTSIAWSSWVPYFSSTFVILSVFIYPCLRTIVSKTAGPNDQGSAQGGITGIGSIASILSPIIFTPLTASFLSENAPFDFKGFSLMCSAFVIMVAFVLSLFLAASYRISKRTAVV